MISTEGKIVVTGAVAIVEFWLGLWWVATPVTPAFLTGIVGLLGMVSIIGWATYVGRHYG